MKNDDLGDRMKMYEGMEAGRRFIPTLPIIARLDGRGFSKFTKGLNRPYDESMSAAMIETTIALVEKTGACMGYTQSDEITLAWHSRDVDSQVFFDGRIQKMTSQLAAIGTLEFFKQVQMRMAPEYEYKNPTFDARVWNVPNRTEGANAFLWREWDATKNSISMAASHYYSHKELMGKNGSQKQDMLHAKGVNWNDYPDFFKRGRFVGKAVFTKKFSQAELEALPPMHEARSNPDLEYTRSSILPMMMPPFSKVMNREDVIFEGAKPIVTSVTNSEFIVN
jgi:tRNA(His) guanylyltransferase